MAGSALAEPLCSDPRVAGRPRRLRREGAGELAPLIEKVRHHAYRIVDADVEGLDPDVVIEATLGAALAVALAERAQALEAIG